MTEQQKDFTRPEYINPVIDMLEFFAENPHCKLIEHEPIKNGIRTSYVIIN